MFVFWRCIYAPLRWRFVIVAVASALGLVERIGGRPLRDRLVGRFDAHVVRSGWPGHPRGWINLHASEFQTRVLRVLGGTTIVRQPRVPRSSPAPLRVGCYGAFSGLLGFPRELIAGCPPTIELVIFDWRFKGRLADYLKPLCRTYVPLEPDAGESRAWLDRVAGAVNAAMLDVFLNIDASEQASSLIERLETPCVVHYNTGSDLMHNPGIDVQMHGQPQADYFAADGVMFCGTTARPFSRQPLRPIAAYYDRRGLDPTAPRRVWAEREPLMVYHGSLYKMAHAEYLDCLFDVMDADRAVTLAFMGKDRQGALAFIRERASRRGLTDRVRYEGEFSAMRDSEGRLDDEGWQRLLRLLDRARLAPNPWPIGGASSRFEGYLMGVPSVHMAVRIDRGSWRRSQPGAVDVPSLQVSAGTATSISGYRELCLRCLHDGQFANQLQQDQNRIARVVSDEATWWRQLTTIYAEWADVHASREAVRRAG